MYVRLGRERVNNKERGASSVTMARGSSLKKKKDAGNGGETNPEAAERRRLKTLAFSSNMLSHTPLNPRRCLSPSKTVIKHHGKDILKKSQRKNRYLFSFPGLLAPVGGGKLGELKDLGTKNPVLYLDFPQVRLFFSFPLLGCLETWTTNFSDFHLSLFFVTLSGSDEVVWYYCVSKEQIFNSAVPQGWKECHV